MKDTKTLIVEEFEEKWKDRGDERYGLVKHNNTILQNQMDWLLTALERVEKEAYERGIKDGVEVHL